MRVAGGTGRHELRGRGPLSTDQARAQLRQVSLYLKCPPPE